MTLTPRQIEDIQVTAIRLMNRLTDQLRQAAEERGSTLDVLTADVTLTVHLAPGQGVGMFSENMLVPLDEPQHRSSGLTTGEKELLFRIAWQAQKAESKPKQVQTLIDRRLVRHVGAMYCITREGEAALSPMAQKALKRPRDFADLPQAEQWAVDRRLGILDWDGS